VILNPSGANYDSLWRDVFKLKLLHGVSIEILVIGRVSQNWHSESRGTKNGPQNSVRERTPLFGCLLKLVGIGEFLEGDSGRVEISRFQSTVGHHVENVNCVMG
jgi:hypothetical protein